MSDSTSAGSLSTCGCCSPGLETPEVSNPPGQGALDYRVGIHSSFFGRLVSRLHQWTTVTCGGCGLPSVGANRVDEVLDHIEKAHGLTGSAALALLGWSRPLAPLQTRDTDDPAIALLDAWAVLGDVLTFYQERIANEGYLRTAVQRRSVLELARAIGYELAPGVAASTYLAFTVDESDYTPDTAVVPAGTQIQSIPASNDELPQTFETTSELGARVEWNAISPRLRRSQAPGAGTTELHLEGITSGLGPGDAVLLVGETRQQEGSEGSEEWDVRVLTEVEADSESDTTRIAWSRGLGDDYTAPAPNPELHALRLRAKLFGQNAPDWRAMPDTIRDAYAADADAQGDGDEFDNWPNFGIPGVADRQIDLDAIYDSIIPGSWLVLMCPGEVELYRVTGVDLTSRTDYTLNAQVSRITLDTGEHLGTFSDALRSTLAFAESELLALAGAPITDPVEGDAIEFDGVVEGLGEEQPLIVSGRLAGSDEDDGHVAEVVFIDRVTEETDGADKYTRVELRESLAYAYERSTVTIHANVAPATHGETVDGEVLGSGSGATSHQQFTLKKSPLTHVTAETASGVASELSVRVDDIEWAQAASLYGLGATDRCYTVRIDDHGKASVMFGDGTSGARPPSGLENIGATYRHGLGLDGNLDADSLTLLKTRPYGITSVTNPVLATGGEDAESIVAARQNAPVTVLTLDRVVSLQDFQDFVRAFAGIGKAAAAALWFERSLLAHVTIAGADGAAVADSSDLYGNLTAALELARDPLVPVRIDSFDERSFNLSAKVLVDAAYDAALVLAELKSVLAESFSFESREFGQAVTAAEIVALMHGVAGVTAVDIEDLHLIDENGAAIGDPLSQVLRAQSARVNDDPASGDARDILPAELLLINIDGVTLEEADDDGAAS